MVIFLTLDGNVFPYKVYMEANNITIICFKDTFDADGLLYRLPQLNLFEEHAALNI